MLLKDFLEKYGVKKKAFANSVGISTTNLWKILKGMGKPSLRTAQKIQEVTEGKVTIKELLNNEDYTLPPPEPSLEQRLTLLEQRVISLEQANRGE